MFNSKTNSYFKSNMKNNFNILHSNRLQISLKQLCFENLKSITIANHLTFELYLQQ